MSFYGYKGAQCNCPPGLGDIAIAMQQISSGALKPTAVIAPSRVTARASIPLDLKPVVAPTIVLDKETGSVTADNVKIPWMDQYTIHFTHKNKVFVYGGIAAVAVIGGIAFVAMRKKKSVAGYRRRKSRR